MASLTETAKKVLMKEGMIPSVSSSQSDPDAGAKAMNPNLATLRPGSRGIEPRFANPNAPDEGEFEQYEDLGGPVTSATDPNPYAKVKTKKDTSRSGQSAVGQEPMKTQGQGVMAEAEEVTEKRKMSRIADAIRANHPNIKDYSDNRVMDAVHNETEDREMREKLVKHFVGEMNEEFEISEELQAFIEEMVEEGYSDDEIAEAIDENFELVEENEGLSAEHRKRVTRILNNIHGDGKVTFNTDDDHITATHNDGVEKRSHGVKVVGDKVKVNKNPFSTSELDESEEEEKGKKEEKSKKMMKEHVDALLAGENLSEDFREKAETIFESAVSTRVQEEVSVLEEAYAKSLEKEVSQIHEQLIEQVDSYLNYVVENWVKENEVAIESGLRTELTEGFISGLRNLFAEHYIDVPEEEVNIVEEMGNKLEKIETRLNEEIDRNVSLSRMLNESKQTEILFSAYDGLTTTQAAKLRSLAENITYTTPEEYETKVQTLKESYFSKSVSQRTHLDPVEDADGRTMIAEEHTGPMAHYVKAIGKTIK